MKGSQRFQARPKKLASCGSVSLEEAGKLAQLPFLFFCIGFLALSVAFCLVLFLDA